MHSLPMQMTFLCTSFVALQVFTEFLLEKSFSLKILTLGKIFMNTLSGKSFVRENFCRLAKIL